MNRVSPLPPARIAYCAWGFSSPKAPFKQFLHGSHQDISGKHVTAIAHETHVVRLKHTGKEKRRLLTSLQMSSKAFRGSPLSYCSSRSCHDQCNAGWLNSNFPRSTWSSSGPLVRRVFSFISLLSHAVSNAFFFHVLPLKPIQRVKLIKTNLVLSVMNLYFASIMAGVFFALNNVEMCEPRQQFE